MTQSIRLFAAGVAATCATSTTLEPVRIDLNRARAPELALLPGIGRGRAEAIVLHRVRNGPFRRLQDLAEVDGVGPDTVDAVAEFVRVELCDTLPAHETATESGR